MMSELVKRIILDQREAGVPELFKRDLALGDVLKPARGNLVKTIIGIRRSGKTYRLFQEMQRIVNLGYSPDSILYFNFEDERLKPFTPRLLSDVIDSFFELFPQTRTEGVFLFFDEIQDVPDWGMFMRRMVDTLKATIYVTGSSSMMLSREVATEFRGRTLSKEIFPLSFSEYMRYQGVSIAANSTSEHGQRIFTSHETAQLKHGCERYLSDGGFIATQHLERPDSIQLLQEYATRALTDDVIERYNVRNPLVASLFLSQCLALSGRELSLNKMRNSLVGRGLPVSRETLASLLQYYEEAYLLFPVYEFTRALAANPRSVPKIYAIDPGMFSAFSKAAAEDRGQRLETAVFLKLRRETDSIREGSISRLLIRDGGTSHEVDFVVGDVLSQQAYRLIQVCWNLDDPKTRHREISALQVAMSRFGLHQATIVTLDTQETVAVDEGEVTMVPAWQWLLDDSMA
ncbi:ATP-binding protein [Bifidobacterium tibiigranuli]|nr:ATP-binding protein [Bifidobacterium tibiigranuli]MCI1220950.1 ATP-binding protein [Bifidobacterium tibiigranuli]MCI1232154.1 ATP-binding protein [Bifidobacterium tibiigranuli]MCI1254117.1 ATP-binding protein [Bifidobacterium tibiigranuli]MCI1791564.1 ATP-binding protein [Bifidobacterium tibiigranuli]